MSGGKHSWSQWYRLTQQSTLLCSSRVGKYLKKEQTMAKLPEFLKKSPALKDKVITIEDELKKGIKKQKPGRLPDFLKPGKKYSDNVLVRKPDTSTA